ncbi:MAG: hypothetical protein IT386_13675 [Deltaproteobacteria bacterium]|nr:hypothetical protein [Deltaproteobacteria bacterium]
MPEISLVAPPARPDLRRAVRSRLADLGLTLRVIAEDLLGADGAIDLVALDPQGGVVLALLADEGGDLELMGRALAQRSWVEPRLRDWLQLSPRLGLAADAPVRLLLLAPGFGPAALAAAQALRAGLVDLATYRCVRNGGAVEVLLERVRGRAPADRAGSRPLSTFRSGLGDADLSLTPEERSDLE